MKNLSLIKNLGHNFALLVITSFTLFTLSACGGSSSGGAAPTPSPSSSPSADVAAAITIDNAGTVPIFAGSSTTSVIYVHNNSNAAISNISYTAKDNNSSNTSTSNKLLVKAQKLFGFKAQSSTSSSLNTASAQICSTIPAGQSCPLSFTVPSTPVSNVQGSLLITATYNNNTVFSQVISYQQINNQDSGAVFNSGVNVSGFGNRIGYATIYLYGSGHNRIYQIGSIISDKTAVTISQGNISGQQLASNAVQAVEVAAIMGNSTSFNTKLSISSVDMASSSSFMSHSLVAITNSGNGAILTTGQVPLINTNVAAPSGQLYIVNSGNSTSTIGSISYPTNISGSSGSGACTSTLAAGAGCTIYFTIATESTGSSSGSGQITVNYTGGISDPSSLAQNVTWYNGTGAPLLIMSANPSSVSFNHGESAATVVTVTNVGGFNLSNFTPAAPTAISGSGSGSVSLLSCAAGGTSLPVGDSCSYTVTVSDSAVETGYLKLAVSASYDGGAQTYERAIALAYTSTTNPTTLTVTGNNALSIIGNNVESQADTLVITNSGSTSATITSSALSSAPSGMTITSNGCSGQTLTSSQTCNVVVRLGPVTSSTTTSGTATYTVGYNSDSVTGISSTADIGYTIQSNTQSIDLTLVTPSGSITGVGSSGSPFQIHGNITSAQTITLTYTNTGTNPIIVTGINNTNSPMSWLINSSSTTCFPNNTNSATIAVNQTCDVVFTNVLYLYTAAVSGLGSSYTENLTVPELVFKDTNATPHQFQVAPTLPSPLSGSTLYVTGYQATITNSASLSGSVATIGTALTNATGYSAITVTSNMEDYFTGSGVSPVLTNCTQTPESGIITQVCTLTPSGGVASASGAYTENSLYSSESPTLNVLFSSSTSGQAVAMSPLAAQLTLP